MGLHASIFHVNLNFLFRLNYTALRLGIDEWLQSLTHRQGRFLGGVKLPKFLMSLTKMVDLDTLVKEIETSIMTSVSCNACKGGQNENNSRHFWIFGFKFMFFQLLVSFIIIWILERRNMSWSQPFPGYAHHSKSTRPAFVTAWSISWL